MKQSFAAAHGGKISAANYANHANKNTVIREKHSPSFYFNDGHMGKWPPGDNPDGLAS